jgi:hypothetical protein
MGFDMIYNKKKILLLTLQHLTVLPMIIFHRCKIIAPSVKNLPTNSHMKYVRWNNVRR